MAKNPWEQSYETEKAPWERTYATPKEPEVKPDTGFTGALKSSTEQIQADWERLKGKVGVKPIEEAEAEAKKHEEKAAKVFKPTEEGWTEAPWQKLKETAGGSLPYMVAPVAAGAAALALPEAVAAAPILGGIATAGEALGMGAAGAASATQFTGSNLSRQVQEGKSLQDASLTQAAMAAIPQAALDVVGLKYVPGIQKIFRSIGQDITEQAAKKMLEQGTLKTAGQYIAGGAKIAGIEGATEAGQQFFERLQAGLNIADPEARKEYLDNFVGGAALGAVAAPFGVHGTRADARNVLDKAQAGRDEQARKDQEEQQAQLELQKQQQATGQLFGETAPVESTQAKGMLEGAVSPLQSAKSTLTVSEREQQENATTQQQYEDTTNTLRQHSVLKNEVKTLEDQVAKAAEEGNVEAITTLSPRLQQMRTALNASKETVKKLSPVEQLPDVQMAELRGSLKKKIVELQKAGGVTGDFEKINNLATQIKEIQTKIEYLGKAGTQFDMFDSAKLTAEKNQAVREQAEQRQQEQADLFAQVPKKEKANPLDRYQEDLAALEEAHASGAEERTIEHLLDNLRHSMVERGVPSAESAEQEAKQKADKTERIKRAIAEEQQNYANATTDEEKATAIANMGALQNRLANAKVEEVQTPEQRQQVAQDAQRAAHDSLSDLVEDVKNKKEISPNAPKIIANHYAKAVYDDVNALREKANQAPLDTTEAIKMASEVHNLVRAAIQHGDITPLERLDASIRTPFERRIENVKSRYSVGKPKVTQKAKDTLRVEHDAAQKLRAAKGGVEKDAVYSAERRVAEAQVEVDRVKKLAEEAKQEGKKLAPYYLEDAQANLKEAKKELAAANKALKEFEPDQTKIRLLEKEVAVAKAEDDRIAAEKEKEKSKQEGIEREHKAPSGVDHAQPSLFTDKELEPIATVRASSRNFMKLVVAQANRIKKARAAVEAAFNKPFEIAKHLFGKAYGIHFAELETTRLKLENERAKTPPSLYVPTEKEKADFSAQYIKQLTDKYAAARKAHFDKIAELEEQEKGILHAIRQTEGEEIPETLAYKVSQQRQFVRDVMNAEELTKNLKFNAQQIWTYKTRALNKLGDLEATPKKTVALKDEIDAIKAAIKEFDANHEDNMRYVDSLYERAEELRTANLAAEKAILRGLENKLAASEKGSPEQVEISKRIAEQRAQLSADEAALVISLQERAVEKRKEEVAQNTRLAKLEKTVPVTKEVNAIIVDEKKYNRIKKRLNKNKAALERLTTEDAGFASLEKRIAADERAIERLRMPIMGATAKTFTAETEEEKTQKARATAQEGVAERLRDKKATEERLAKGLSGKIADAKFALGWYEKALKKVNTQTKQLLDAIKVATRKVQAVTAQLDKATTPKAKTILTREKNARQQELDAANARYEKERIPLGEKGARYDAFIKDLKEKGVGAERAMTYLAAQSGRREVGIKPSPAEKATTKANVKTAKQIEDARRTDQAYAKENNISYDLYHEITEGLKHGFKARIGEGRSSGIQMLRSAAQAVVDKIKIPKGLNVTVIQDLSPTMKQYISERGYNPDLTKGFVTENGDVVIVAANHKTTNEIAETLAHEITGHLGVEAVLGKEGMAALVKKITTQKGGVMALADKLGVGDDAHAAYTAALDSGQTKDKALEAAVHEMIAHTAEKHPSKDWVGKANEWIKALVGEFRAALRRMGISLDTNTSDVYKLLREARRDFKEVNPGAYKEANGNIQFSSKPSYNSKFADLGGDVSKIVHANRTAADKVKSVAAGFKTPNNIVKTGGILSPENLLALRTRYIDRFAPIEKVAEQLTAKLKSSLEGTQLMYYLRMFDQGINWVAQTAAHGPMSIIEKKRKDGKVERIVETKEGASLLKVSQALKEADVGDANAANQLFTFYLAAKRAANKGLDTLNFGPDVTEEMLKKVMDRINSDAKTKAAFEKAAGIYNEYNRGLVEFGVQTGRFSKEEAAKLLKENDYVPFYRIDKNGDIALDIGGATPIHIGNIKNQPYLHELAGDNKPILDVFTSALQNTRMLTDMSLRNLATRNVAFSLQELGLLKVKKSRAGKEFGSGIYPGKMEAGPDVIHFKIDGVDHHAIVDTESIGIPAELLVKGMDGVQTSIPNLVKVAGYPARLLRSFITRNPAYAVRQIARDSLSNAFVTGSNSIPIIDNLKELGSMLKGVNEGELLLKSRGILGGQVLGNASDAMQKAMLQIIDGKPGWEKAMAYLDHVAMMGDASSRITSYNSFIKQGLSDMEATLAALEAMNFSKKGTSPSLYLLNQMVPFLNAQIQGMDVLYKAFAGKMPFADKLDIKKKIWQRGAMMAAFTMAYTAMSYDDDDYKNATASERIGNWFIKVPGIDEKVKVPIPFEVGGIFKMLPEMLYSTMFRDKKLGEAASETSKYVVDNFLPSFTPTAIKPVIELGSNYSFFTGKPIESQRLMELAPGQRSYANTPEALKLLGEATNISPVKMEYMLRAYTGSLPLAVLSLANPVGGAERPEGRGALSSTSPVIGAFFQPKDANGLVDKAYQQMQDVIQADRTYKNYIDSGRNEEAEAYITKEADLIGMASFSGDFRHQMGTLAKQERAIRSMTGISGAEKRAALDEIKDAKIELSKAFLSARE